MITFEKKLEVDFAICDLSVIPVRADTSDKSEMISQILFGEVVEVQERVKQWVRVHTYWDNYSGWIDEKQIQPINIKTFRELTTGNGYCAFDTMGMAKSKYRSLLLLAGSSLPYYKDEKFRINDEAFDFTGVAVDTSEPNNSQRIPEIAMKYLHTPYLWGGRSVFGIDCSGFTNVVFKLAGIPLRRDAWQQSEQGVLVSFIDQARAGDLAFFHNEEGKINHVGIVMEKQQVIHASGRVRIDTVDHYGIFNEEQKRYTHQLRFIKRMIS